MFNITAWVSLRGVLVLRGRNAASAAQVHVYALLHLRPAHRRHRLQPRPYALTRIVEISAKARSRVVMWPHTCMS